MEQDKPRRPPPRPRGSIPRTTHLPFRFDYPLAAAGAPFGVLPRTTDVVVGETALTVRFGPWRLETDLANISGVEVTGPYQALKVAGPPHLSFTDRGVTFATTTQGGICVHFHRPVPAIDPLGLLRHPGATITVADPDDAAAELEAAVRRAT
ncbi:hypothetical protein PO878_05815 [Iamia majanohamensis]|uniref:Uncharacterized protein n=1 Tax=Iamia majanohamensis TaxID=467976 RepID=A0AAF0BUW5_9ACTN|nr:hypothetical protein [Iamia majanohamensis]WCO68242.1 hypothetical protein PO878_05815 [Iamia majanohamensis]